MPTIYYTPFDNTLNAYTDRMKFLFSAYGEVKRIDKKAFFIKILKLNFNDVIIVNWLENIIIDKQGNISLLGFFKLVLIFICFRLMFKKFIYVRHNHYPHSCNLKHAKTAKKILDIFERLAHVTIVHSPVEATNGRFYVPHPLYPAIQNIIKFKDNNRFVIFGSISRYKKIEKVISEFPEHLSLLVMGKCSDSTYLEELNILIKAKNNIEILSEYISDEKAQELIMSSAGMLITHNDDDMIVSGSFFYAISIGSKVFVLKTPFFEWACNQLGNTYVQQLDDIKSLYFINTKVNSDRVSIMPEVLFGDSIVKNALDKVIH